MQPRTRKQREALDYITRFIERHGYEPSYAQIARHFRVSSKATIAKHIDSLERQVLLSRRPADGGFGLNVRGEEVASDAVCEALLLCLVAPSQPLDTVTDSETISVPRFMLGRNLPAQVYALRVTGDSMID